MKKIDPKQEGTFAILAALIVLFSSMWNPWVSVGVSIGTLLLYSIYKFITK
jgi:hypothetical protein